jgi:hypothetical protein
MYIIINPDNGPESSTPSAAFQKCLSLIKSAGPNAVMLGYVLTGQGSRSVSDVEADINLYAAWGDAFRPTGIFFDEVSEKPKFVTQYAGFASFARQQNFDFVCTRYIKPFTPRSFLPYPWWQVTFNPGTPPDSGYFSSGADLIVTAEVSFDSFSTSDLVISSSTPAAMQAVLLYQGPTTSPTSLIDDLADLGINSVFITDDTLPNPWDTVPTAWSEEVADIAAA